MSCAIVYPLPPIIVSNFPEAQATAYGVAFPNTAPVWSAAHFFTGLGWDLDTPLQEVTVLAAAALSATFLSGTLLNRGGRGIIWHVNISALAPGQTWTPGLQALDPASGGFGTLFSASAALAAPGLYTYELSPGVGAPTGGTGVTAFRAGALPRSFRLTLGMGGAAGTSTISLSYQLVR